MHSARRLLNARSTLLVALLAGCSSGPSAPSATVLHIRLFDDGGQPAGRHQVVVASALGEPFTRVSGGDGTLDVALADGGSYRVSVIPRAGFVSTPALTRQVQVAGHARAVVDFTIPRAGVSAGTVSGSPPTVRSLIDGGTRTLATMLAVVWGSIGLAVWRYRAARRDRLAWLP